MATVVLTNGCALQVKKSIFVSRCTSQINSSSGSRCVKVGVADGRRVRQISKSSTMSMLSNWSHVEVKSAGKERKTSNAIVEDEEEEEEGLLMDDVERLGEMALQDGGQSPEDYQRRAKLFEELARRVAG